MKKQIFAAIEAGGTKWIVSVGSDYQTAEQIRIPTEHPDITLAAARDFIHAQIQAQGEIASIGIGSFGPLGVDPTMADYGIIGNTPKPHWAGTDLTSVFADFSVPLAIESDVNAAALAEANALLTTGSGRLIYVTIGTGIGAGVAENERVSNGVHHPEMGHIRLPKHPHDSYQGHCPTHRDCLEGLACGPAISARWGADLSALGPEHEANEIIAFYLGTFCANLLLSYAPNVIVLGGGVSLTPGLIERVQEHAFDQLGGYLGRFASPEDLHQVIRTPSLDTFSGIAGAYLLAEGAGVQS